MLTVADESIGPTVKRPKVASVVETGDDTALIMVVRGAF